MKFENFIKGIITTLLGLAMMGYSFYGWYFPTPEDQLKNWEAIVLGCIGFSLCWLRLKIEETLSKLLGDLPAMVWDKFFGKKQQQ